MTFFVFHRVQTQPKALKLITLLTVVLCCLFCHSGAPKTASEYPQHFMVGITKTPPSPPEHEGVCVCQCVSVQVFLQPCRRQMTAVFSRLSFLSGYYLIRFGPPHISFVKGRKTKILNVLQICVLQKRKRKKNPPFRRWGQFQKSSQRGESAHRGRSGGQKWCQCRR